MAPLLSESEALGQSEDGIQIRLLERCFGQCSLKPYCVCEQLAHAQSSEHEAMGQEERMLILASGQSDLSHP
jgi:hypothetical protein